MRWQRLLELARFLHLFFGAQELEQGQDRLSHVDSLAKILHGILAMRRRAWQLCQKRFGL